jgi:hypothetical protein
MGGAVAVRHDGLSSAASLPPVSVR